MTETLPLHRNFKREKITISFSAKGIIISLWVILEQFPTTSRDFEKFQNWFSLKTKTVSNHPFRLLKTTRLHSKFCPVQVTPGSLLKLSLHLHSHPELRAFIWLTFSDTYTLPTRTWGDRTELKHQSWPWKSHNHSCFIFCSWGFVQGLSVALFTNRSPVFPNTAGFLNHTGSFLFLTCPLKLYCRTTEAGRAIKTPNNPWCPMFFLDHWTSITFWLF